MKLEEWIEVAKIEAAKVGFTGFERALGELLKMELSSQKYGENVRLHNSGSDDGDVDLGSRWPKR